MSNNEVLKLYTYVSNEKAQRNKIFLQQNLISLLEQGEKVVHYDKGKTIISDNQFALLTWG
ncbi:thiamine pyrophosphokinase [Chitinophaga terrae (ex Kim and Jung 2007)]|uniref:hypothetical protein n=1 Tax=Chitinophaga terrae (ex Kim and Jung 2007) TaxID=408074 RepID=UPI00277DE79E|nr:hypothetical protein [Chitinophaga terrae (ex Kim and Jung 2007)]MDQ0110502.1 thiamine pyrophosphokinase [Chitinophaga terrae (ex Kim and Jung 2007)]